MPTYDYQCEKCGAFEFHQKMSDPPLTACPQCGGGRVEKLFSRNVNFLFKGSGFYITDYRSDDYKKKAAAETKGEGSAKAEAPACPSGACANPQACSGGRGTDA